MSFKNVVSLISSTACHNKAIMAEGCKTYSSTSVELFSLLLVPKSKPRIFFFIILLSGYCRTRQLYFSQKSHSKLAYMQFLLYLCSKFMCKTAILHAKTANEK